MSLIPLTCGPEAWIFVSKNVAADHKRCKHAVVASRNLQNNKGTTKTVSFKETPEDSEDRKKCNEWQNPNCMVQGKVHPLGYICRSSNEVSYTFHAVVTYRLYHS